MFHTIGDTAGEIWQLLKLEGSMSMNAIVGKIKRPQASVYMGIGWPYDIMVAMVRLVCCGIFDKFPDIKIYTHLTAGGIAYYADRLGSVLGHYKRTVPNSELEKLRKPPVEYLRMFYSDTEMSYTVAALECTYAFFGAEHLVYSSGMPYGTEYGHSSIGGSINCIKRMRISNSDRQKIFEGNARRLLHLSKTG